jgi:putative flippase GtrA
VITINANRRQKVIRFVLTGLLNTLFGYSVFAALTSLRWPDTLSVPVAMAAGVGFNFMSYGKLVFASVDIRRLPRFVGAYLCLYLCNVIGLRTLARFGMNAYAAQAMLVIPLAVFAYFINDRWVFRGT